MQSYWRMGLQHGFFFGGQGCWVYFSSNVKILVLLLDLSVIMQLWSPTEWSSSALLQSYLHCIFAPVVSKHESDCTFNDHKYVDHRACGHAFGWFSAVPFSSICSSHQLYPAITMYFNLYFPILNSCFLVIFANILLFMFWLLDTSNILWNRAKIHKEKKSSQFSQRTWNISETKPKSIIHIQTVYLCL